MEESELDKIIESLESSNSKKEAYMSLSQYGGGMDECFAKANKQGLELFASQLLKASKDFKHVVEDPEKRVIPMNYEEEWLENSDVFIQYIEPVNRLGAVPENDTYKESLIDKIIPIGCLTLFILLVISSIIGLITIGSWIIQ